MKKNDACTRMDGRVVESMYSNGQQQLAAANSSQLPTAMEEVPVRSPPPHGCKRHGQQNQWTREAFENCRQRKNKKYNPWRLL